LHFACTKQEKNEKITGKNNRHEKVFVANTAKKAGQGWHFK
jgi:hypothetical protein